MKMKLLRYLSVFALVTFLISCEDDEKLTDDFPPEDAKYYTFKPLQLTETVDLNGNTFFSAATLVVDADISSEAEEGFSKQVVIQIVSVIEGEEKEITRGGAFALSGNGSDDVKTFNLNFDNIVERKGEINLGANILEAGTGRKIKGAGILINVETLQEDQSIPYKVRFIDWSDSIDRNGDGFFTVRDVRFIVATEGNVSKTLNGNVKLINDFNSDTTVIFQTGDFLVQREGFSNVELSFTVNNDNSLGRAGYEILMEFAEAGAPGVIVFEALYKAADLVRIGFEPVVADNREYSLSGTPNVSLLNLDTILGYYDSVIIDLSIMANADLTYFDLDNTQNEFDLRSPYVRIQYWRINDPTFVDYLNLTDSNLIADPVNPQSFSFVVSELVPKKDSATYEFKIQIMEDSRNYFNSTEDVAVVEYTKDDFPALGNVKMDPKGQ